MNSSTISKCAAIDFPAFFPQIAVPQNILRREFPLLQRLCQRQCLPVNRDGNIGKPIVIQAVR